MAVDTSLPDVALQPQAAPVQSYVRPAVDQNAGSGLMELARSLQGFAQPLQDYIKVQDDKAAQADALKARADFIRTNASGYDEAVKQGLIPASASPAYVNSWKQAQGDVAGSQLELEAQHAYDMWPGKNSQDPQAFNGFLNDFLRTRIGATSDPETLKGLLPRIKGIQTALMNRHLQDQDALVRNGAKEALGAQGNSAIDDAHSIGLATGEPNYGKAFEAWENNRAKFPALSDDEAHKVMYEGITAAAVAHNDPKILDFFDRKVPGQDYTYKSTPDGQKAYGQAVEKLDVIGRQKRAEDAAAFTAADKAAKEKTQADALAIISKDPKAPLPDELNARGKLHEGAWDSQVQTWRKQFSDAHAATDPDALAQLNRDIMDDPANGTKHVVDALNTGSLKASDFETTYRFAQDVEKNGASYSKALQLPQVNTILGAIKQRTAPSDVDFNAHPDDITNDGLRAQSDYRRQILQWVAGHPEEAKDPIKLGEAVDKIGANILGGISPAAGSVGGQYNGPDGGKGNAFGANPPPPPPAPPEAPKDTRNIWQRNAPEALGGLPAPGVPQAAPPSRAPILPAPQSTAPVAPVEPPAAPPAEVDKWVSQQPPAFAKALNDAAAGSKDPAGFRAGVYRRYLEATKPKVPAPAGVAPDGTPAGKTSFDLGQSPGQLVDAALNDPHGALDALQHAVGQQGFGEQGSSAFETAFHPTQDYKTASTVADHRAASILDFISQPEARGNYNAQFGNAGSTENLSKYSINDVLKLQSAQVRAGAKSSAIGRYQFIRGTLKSAAEEAGLSGSTKFTPDVQDRLALVLLKRRGYGDWVNGHISDQAFANNLAKEWASLPVISTGRSFYAGDGLNRSLVSPGQVLALLGGNA